MVTPLGSAKPAGTTTGSGGKDLASAESLSSPSDGVKSEANDLNAIGTHDLGPGHSGWKENAEAFKAYTVHFEYDSSTVKPSEQSKLEAVAQQLKGNSSAAVKIEGHCDERGTEEYNRSLGERRAIALREELIKLGVEASRVDTISFGEDKPAVPGHDEAAWKENRRGEFIELTPPAAVASNTQ
jgi:peptidoglycan-associated lipoprotein